VSKPKAVFYEGMGLVIPKGTRVYARHTKSAKGITTGGLFLCRLEGCGGTRVAVRWPNGRITFPCLKGMEVQQDGSLRIL